MASEVQLLSPLEPGAYLTLKSSQKGYCVVDLRVEKNRYSKVSTWIDGNSESKPSYSQLGETGIRGQQLLDWDVPDNELGQHGSRVRSLFLPLQFSLATPFDISNSNAPELLKLMAGTSARGTWWAVQHCGFTFVFSVATAFQRWLAPSHEVASNLLSPFGEIAYSTRAYGGDFYCWIRSGERRTSSEGRINRTSWISPSACLCIAYWLGVQSHKEELASLSASLESGSELTFPKHELELPTAQIGIRVGKMVYVQTFLNMGTLRWPLVFRKLYFVRAGHSKGMTLTLEAKPSGQYRVLRQGLEKRQAEEVRAMFEKGLLG